MVNMTEIDAVTVINAVINFGWKVVTANSCFLRQLLGLPEHDYISFVRTFNCT